MTSFLVEQAVSSQVGDAKDSMGSLSLSFFFKPPFLCFFSIDFSFFLFRFGDEDKGESDQERRKRYQEHEQRERENDRKLKEKADRRHESSRVKNDALRSK